MLIVFFLFRGSLGLNVIADCVRHNTNTHCSDITTVTPKFTTPKLFPDFREFFEKLLAVMLFTICITLEGEYLGAAPTKIWT